MARSLTVDQANALNADSQSYHIRVRVANGSGTLVDLSDWFEGIVTHDDIDQFTTQATLEFRRDGGTLSLAPLREDSTLNRLDDGTTYSPQLDAGRLVVFEQATLPINGTPIAGDWVEILRGYLDGADASQPTIRADFRDLGGVLVDRFVEIVAETEQVFGDPVGKTLQANIQDVLDFGTLGITLYKPDTESSLWKQWKQVRESFADAVRRLASVIGWVIRYKWDEGTAAWRLTLYDPQRTKTVPDWTLGPSRYYSVKKLEIDRLSVRNVITVWYSLDTAGVEGRASWTTTDATSIAKYGRQVFTVHEPGGPDRLIRTTPEAQAMASAILLDLRDPKAEVEVEMPFYWPIELHDLVRIQANGVHSNVDQDWAVVSISHNLSINSHRTTLKLRGKPAGQFFYWRKPRDLSGRPGELPSIVDGSVTINKAGIATIHLFGAVNTKSFRVPHNIDVGIPAVGDVAGWSYVNAVNGEASFVVGAPTALTVGQTLYWRARGYSELNGVGLESPEDAIGSRTFGEDTVVITMASLTFLNPARFRKVNDFGLENVDPDDPLGVADGHIDLSSRVPPGALLKRVIALCSRSSTTVAASAAIIRIAKGNPASWTQLAVTADPTALDTWQERTGTLSETVDHSAYTYRLQTSMGPLTLPDPPFAGTGHGRLAWIKVDFTPPSQGADGGVSQTLVSGNVYNGDVIGVQVTPVFTDKFAFETP